MQIETTTIGNIFGKVSAGREPADALKLRAANLAIKAKQFASFLKADGSHNHHPDPEDYLELACMIETLAARVAD